MEHFMKQALTLARRGAGLVNPNPMVGAVLVRNNQVIGQGYHQYYGGHHAEVMAIGVKKNLEDATLYVTLEPCCHQGKTPACTNLILASGIKHVVVACQDPNPLVAGKGIAILRQNGVKVTLGLLEAEAKKMNETFNHYIRHKTPFVLLKYAMTLDGNIATRCGDSKWISNESSRQHVHGFRHDYAGILVGVNTIIADNPRLNTRINKGRDPRVIVLDSRGRIPLDCRVLGQGIIVATTEFMTQEKRNLLVEKGAEVIVTKSLKKQVNLKALMIKLGRAGIDSLIVEGGKEVHTSFIKAGLARKIHVYIAPKIIGSGKSPLGELGIDLMEEALDLKDVSFHTFGNNILVEAYMEAPCLQA